MTAKEKADKILFNKEQISPTYDIADELKELKGELEFGLARRILQKFIETDSNNIWLKQQLALCTYKDEELPSKSRFRNALNFLAEIGLNDPDKELNGSKIDPKTIPETLALGGAVYKRMWEYEGQIEYLNIARVFILDILASREKEIQIKCGMDPENSHQVKELRKKAKELRQDLAEKLPEFAKEIESESSKPRDLKSEYWYVVTMAEIYFGLGNYDESSKWLSIARDLNADEWETQTTFKQLVQIARLQGLKFPHEEKEINNWHPAWKALSKLLEEDTKNALNCFRGKTGLALSGGGFRASLYHIGVLARLAEMDVLRGLEVLSTVSGGSIVGAHYYLEVQDLLKQKLDKDITCEDYIDLVHRLQDRFLKGVQKNLRTRALSNLLSNFRMIFSKEYSRSHRLGELYENEIYSVIGESKKRRKKPRTVQELLITPADQQPGKPFKPKFHNWRRISRVPILLLNTTSLNSGHSWHFTSRWMGEPPGAVSTEVDVNERYRRLWYRQASKEQHKNYQLGYSVAASACVPGLFEPLVLEGLYPGRTVKLVDGGVHDNQGVEALLDEGCTLVLCSDASGQMEDVKRPSSSILGVPLRANSILMDRVREAQFQDLQSRVNNSTLLGLFFIHLKKDLETLPIDWIDCDNPTQIPEKFSATTEYGVDKDLQFKLANKKN